MRSTSVEILRSHGTRPPYPEFQGSPLYAEDIQYWQRRHNWRIHLSTPLCIHLVEGWKWVESYAKCNKFVILFIASHSLHRNYFARALLEYPNDPMGSPFAPSFLTTYKTALTLIKIAQGAQKAAPLIMLRMWIVWSRALACSVNTLSKQLLPENVRHNSFYAIDCCCACSYQGLGR